MKVTDVVEINTRKSKNYTKHDGGKKQTKNELVRLVLIRIEKKTYE